MATTSTPLKDFLNLHGGTTGNRVRLDNVTMPDGKEFVSLRTVDGTCFLAFAKKQFSESELNTRDKVKNILRTQGNDLAVIPTVSASGTDGWTIIRDTSEAFDF